MFKFDQALKRTSSIAALLSGIALMPNLAHAQPASTAGGSVATEEVTVTGTNIRGVAPIGSHIVGVDQDQIQAIAPISVTEISNSLPALSGFGTAPQGENSYTFYTPNIHNLAASASSSTLVVLDGMRIPGGGPQWAEADPNIIPVVALQRVDVLADGASSIYGSDAVSGVVNYITRKSFDGIQFDAQMGFGDHYGTTNADVLWGTHWDSGNVMMAASYSYGTNIPITARPFAAMGDYTPLGGNNQQTYACTPATIRVTAPGAGSGSTGGSPNYYLSPSATSTIVGTTVNSPCNNSIYGGDIIPTEYRTNILAKATQQFFGGRLTVSDTLIYNDLHTNQSQPVGTISATAYAAGAGVAGQQNPFFQAPAGYPTANTETVSWIDTLNPNPQYTTVEDVIYNKLDLSYDITENWHATLTWALGENTSLDNAVDSFCASCAYLALNGTAQSSGSTTTTNIAGRNVIALNTPLTTANALDVWDPASSNKTSAAVIRSLQSANSSLATYNTTNQARGVIDGALFDLPAGPVHVALGGELYTQHILRNAIAANNTGPSSSGEGMSVLRYHRVVQSGFLEVAVPLVSPDMNIPLINKLDFDISGRIDSFSDVGTSSNPKYAVDWKPVDDLTVRANYSTSFVAPPLLTIGDPSLGYQYTTTTTTTGAVFSNIPVAAFPLVAQVPGVACSTVGTPIANCKYFTVGQTSGANGDQGIERQLGGGLDNVKPETGNTWSVGMDYAPHWLPGLQTSITLFNNSFKGAVNAARMPQVINSPNLYRLLQFYPSGATQAQIDAFTNVANGAPVGALPAGKVYYTFAHDETNFLYLRDQGVDFSINYTYDAGPAGIFRLADNFTGFTQVKEGYDGITYFSINGTSGFNGTFSSVSYGNRLGLGWDIDRISVDGFINYTPKYRNWYQASVNPIINDANGNPIGGGDVVKSWTTLDLNVAYNFEEGWLGGDSIFVNVKNLFDTDPPFDNTTAGGSGASSGAAFGFNAFNASPIGRTVAIGLRAKF